MEKIINSITAFYLLPEDEQKKMVVLLTALPLHRNEIINILIDIEAQVMSVTYFDNQKNGSSLMQFTAQTTKRFFKEFKNRMVKEIE